MVYNESSSIVKNLKEIAYDMKLLLVEDDSDLRVQLKIFLGRFFGCIHTAENGIEALKMYKEESYDLVLTDLTMPLMGGLELAEKIRMQNSEQNILILSGHSESDKLITLINLGIDGFLLKPVDLSRVLTQLNKSAQAIYDHKMFDYFSTTLEETNQELRKSNAELHKALAEIKRMKQSEPLNMPHEQLSGRELNDDEKMMLYTRSEKMSAAEFHSVHPFELDKTNEDLEILEDNFNVLLVSAERNINQETLSVLSRIVHSYAKELEMIPQFSALSYGIQQLATTFDSIEDVSKIPSIMPMLTSLFDNLEQWRRGIFFYRNVEDIHYMDNSLISDALSLQGMLSNQHHTSSDSDIELF
ncbi:MAG: response regulator [Sulfuricurvum sp.]|uniref:response regulator n=1 Tax=Sulfuricurvum sp. TaxID=2025608 RepID=UPI0027356892|nr:response regulator [Sulfuricurvum sp.]MDP2851405.1 response regulator [Sulfuricurvum sp.]